MKKLKLVTVVGTRPEIIRLLESLMNWKILLNIIYHTGQNYDYELTKFF